MLLSRTRSLGETMKKPAPKNLTLEQQLIRDLSERIVQAQKPLQILDAIKWGPEIKTEFFKHKAKELPKVNAEYYKQHNPLLFDVADKLQEFHDIQHDIKRQLGQFSGIGTLMYRTCLEYRAAIQMLNGRGTDQFVEFSKDLYGSSLDAFYPGAPTLNDFAVMLTDTLSKLKLDLDSEKDEKKYSSEEVVEILNKRLSHYFYDQKDGVVVLQHDSILSDAAAGSHYIKIRKGAKFSERDIQLYEVHEAWVHVGTSLNGAAQPICTFLGKGPPSSAITQEGLAVITEIFTFSSYPERMQKLVNRIRAINIVETGGDFLDVYRFFLEQRNGDEDAAYNLAVRVFRGSAPNLGPFTKDLSYTQGFILIYNYIRLAIQMGLTKRVPLLFVGKLRLEDIQTLHELTDEGLIVQPKYIPPQFKDLAALSSWMSFTLFLNRLDLKKLAENYHHILHD